MEAVRIIIVDDHALMRAGLKLMLSSQQDIIVVGEAADGFDALECISKNKPDIVLLDLSMPGMNGLECLKKIREMYPEVKVILLTMHEDTQYLRQGLSAGAMGYVLKKAADDVLFQAIRAVRSGAVFMPMSMSQFLINDVEKVSRAQITGHAKGLSEKEKKVLSYIAGGYANAEIAEKLVISAKTVETYKYRIMEKLNTRKRSELVKYAMEHGLIGLDD